jgi:hypothetical protein
MSYVPLRNLDQLERRRQGRVVIHGGVTVTDQTTFNGALQAELSRQEGEGVVSTRLASFGRGGNDMAKYGKAASKSVRSTMRRRKSGTLKSGSGRTVKSRKQAIAIGLSEARKKGAKVPRRKNFL